MTSIETIFGVTGTQLAADANEDAERERLRARYRIEHERMREQYIADGQTLGDPVLVENVPSDVLTGGCWWKDKWVSEVLTA